MNPSPHTRTTCTVIVLVCVGFLAPARGQTPPQPLAILDVPFMSQSEALCGGAAAAMVLRYWGERGLDAESFAHLLDRSAGGIRTTALIADLRGRGWNATAVAGSETLIDDELGRGRPVITLIEDRPGAFHYVVVVAATPKAFVFHDPARSPFRVMEREPFVRRWSAADRWMAIVVPGERAAPVEPPAPAPVPEPSSCSQMIADGVQHARAGELDAAERNLTASLSCGGMAAMRELAGLRLLQRRWPEVSELASAAVAADSSDAYAWQLLATSRFVQSDPDGALEAWNRIEQPRVDLVAVAGLTRTRQRVVERLLDVRPQSLLTPDLLSLTARRLQDLPAAERSRLEYVPRASGVAELRATIVERPPVPAGVWSYAALGVVAVARREVALTMGSFTGGGERIIAAWRFWPDRPRASVDLMTPAPWGGLWGADLFAERQPFTDQAFAENRRTGGGLTLSNWITSWARMSARVGVDAWEERATYGVTSGALQLASRRDHVLLDLDVSGWAGDDPFGSMNAIVRVRSTREHRGRVWLVRAGSARASASTPPDLWFAGDTGSARPVFLRAHPVIDDGRLRSERLGRGIAHVSGEARQWWSIRSSVQLGAAIFADAARVTRGIAGGSRSDVDMGAGLRLGVPLMPGVLRVDIGKGLRDGATALSFVYER